jgi:2-dehydropantoate 2-reductase
MNVLIYGAGSLGSLLAAHLAGRNDVLVVGRRAHVDAINREGLRVEGVRAMHVRLQAKERLSGDEAPDLVVLAVKAYDTKQAIEALKPVVSAATTLITVQNGLGNYEALREAFPTNPVLAASITYGAMLQGPGRVMYAGRGEMLLGGLSKDLGAAGQVGRLMREAGLQALGVPDIRGHLWQKAIVNAAINPLSALTRKTNGELLEDHAIVERMRKITDEGAAVARAQKIPLPERDVFAVVTRIAQATAKNRSSMLQDVERGRRTEIEQINGVIVDAGRRLGIPTPENQAVLEAVRGLARAA